MVINPSHEHICWGGGHDHHSPHTLKVEHVSVHYGPVCALEDINFEISCGHTLAVMGPNGAGKSTLINVIAGLIKPQTGQVLWNGEPLTNTRGELAYLPQKSNVDWAFPLTVRALVEMGRYPSLGPWKKFNRHDQEIVDQSLETLRLTDLADRQIGALSGGQQQRVFLAKALAQEAHLLLLDEPFAGLDSPSCDALGQLLQLLAEEGRLIIVSHHDLNTVGELFDSLLLLRKNLICFGQTGDMLTPELIDQTYRGDTLMPHPVQPPSPLS